MLLRVFSFSVFKHHHLQHLLQWSFLQPCASRSLRHRGNAFHKAVHISANGCWCHRRWGRSKIMQDLWVAFRQLCNLCNSSLSWFTIIRILVFLWVSIPWCCLCRSLGCGRRGLCFFLPTLDLLLSLPLRLQCLCFFLSGISPFKCLPRNKSVICMTLSKFREVNPRPESRVKTKCTCNMCIVNTMFCTPGCMSTCVASWTIIFVNSELCLLLILFRFDESLSSGSPCFGFLLHALGHGFEQLQRILVGVHQMLDLFHRRL